MIWQKHVFVVSKSHEMVKKNIVIVQKKHMFVKSKWFVLGRTLFKSSNMGIPLYFVCPFVCTRKNAYMLLHLKMYTCYISTTKVTILIWVAPPNTASSKSWPAITCRLFFFIINRFCHFVTPFNGRVIQKYYLLHVRHKM